MPKFKSSNKFTKNFNKKSPFKISDEALVNAANAEVQSRYASKVQKGMADSSKTHGFGWQVAGKALSSLATGVGTALGGTDYFSKEKVAERKKAKKDKATERGFDSYSDYKKSVKSKKKEIKTDKKYQKKFSKHIKKNRIEGYEDTDAGWTKYKIDNPKYENWLGKGGMISDWHE